MTLRKFFTVAALTAGLVGAPVTAAEPETTLSYGFSTLKAATPEAAKSKSEAWLKSTGKFDRASFDKVWAQENLTVLDRVADSLALGNAEAAKLLADVRKADAPAPEACPALLKDAKQDAFFRANLATAFAKAVGVKKAYEESLEALTAVAPEQTVDPATYFFYKAVAEHSLMKRQAAFESTYRLVRDVPDAPSRYKVVAILMSFELEGWAADPKDFSNIERLMDNSGRRLDLARADEKTQDYQKKIIFRLDEVIKDLENQSKSGNSNGGNCPNGGVPGNKPGNTIKPSSNAADSVIMGGSGPGKVDDKKLREYRDSWGTLPPEKRAAVVAELTRDYPARYKPFIEEYVKSLNKMHGFPDK